MPLDKLQRSTGPLGWFRKTDLWPCLCISAVATFIGLAIATIEAAHGEALDCQETAGVDYLVCSGLLTDNQTYVLNGKTTRFSVDGDLLTAETFGRLQSVASYERESTCWRKTSMERWVEQDATSSIWSEPVWAEKINYLAGTQTVRAEGQPDLVTQFEPSLNCFAQDYPELMLDTLSTRACGSIEDSFDWPEAILGGQPTAVVTDMTGNGLLDKANFSIRDGWVVLEFFLNPSDQRRCTADHAFRIQPVAEVEGDLGSEIVRSFQFGLRGNRSGSIIVSKWTYNGSQRVPTHDYSLTLRAGDPFTIIGVDQYGFNVGRDFPSYSVNLLTGRQITRRHAAMDGSVMWEDNRINPVQPIELRAGQKLRMPAVILFED